MNTKYIIRAEINQNISIESPLQQIKIEKSIIGFVLISERAMMLNISCDGGTINLIQVYAPTVDKSDEEIENFFADFKCSYNNYEETRYH